MTTTMNAATTNPQIAYLNGAFQALSETRISVLDRGFLFGDGVYEVIPVYENQPFRLDAHLDRLAQSLDALQIADPLTRGEWHQMVTQLIHQNGGGDLAVYIQVTRGVETRRDHFYSDDTTPTVFAMASRRGEPPAETIEHGVSAITVDDPRWTRCDVKAITLLANVLSRQEARHADANEAIYIRDGRLTEGAASNIFLVKGGVLITPPKSQSILPGITRDALIDVARNGGIPVDERPVDQTELASADELLMTSSTKEVLAITRLNHQPVGTGRPGPVSLRLRNLWRQSLHTWLAEQIEESATT